ncbi:electron transfer flavoprotein subunit beta/FixA family protein [Burkholderia humptydooensis]|uniref:Electron transfer flavoprotein subunit beta/FixA family protein n=1 Tax=Burkholderia humptydooensis TaxID=430531 RepID=A0A7U4P596_9BURK|nr:MULTISPECIES: electron transfer flavoprotein subunit beta/FixA family protein [Burkholderia]AJY42441.1 electron transfer flavodomain protein [Burkholderia sp. 2002721687]ALX43183.1 electron transfer flavoprotein subunit beta [Burkholderia humptydooensis]QPS44906.1 electron transfer flavoprotein subunit beta/FixA family protein [Burkholderia humptydooensis]
MHIVVTLKQVHDPNSPAELLKLSADGRSIQTPAGVGDVANGYDVNAVEEAIRIRDKIGGTISVISVGSDEAKAHLRRAIAMGADKAVHISGPHGLDSDPSVVAALLANAVRKLPPADLVLSGRQASDTDSGQVLFRLAEQLGLGAVSPVKQVQEVTESAIVVDRLTDDGMQRVKAELPVLLGISNEANKPRSPSLKGVMASKKADLTTWSQADLLQGDVQPSVVLRRVFFEPVSEVRAELISGSGSDAGRALAERLHQEGVI